MASIDSVLDNTPRVQYTASAAQVDFDYPFAIFEDGDLVVDVDGTVQTLTTDYTVTGEGNDNGGTVTFVSAMSGGEIVTIYRDVSIARSTDFAQNGPWSSASFNDELDRLTIVQQDLENKIGRAIRFPQNSLSTNAQAEMSPISSFFGKLLRIGSTGLLEAAEISDSVVTLTAEVIGALINPRTQAEIDAGVTPTNYRHPIGYVRRYGTNTTPGTTDMTAAIDAAISVAEQTAQTSDPGAGRVVFDNSEQYLTTGVSISADYVQIGSYDGAILVLSGNGTLLEFTNTSGNRREGCEIFGNLRLKKSTVNWYDGTDTTSVAVKLQNCYRFRWARSYAEGFNTALYLIGDGIGCVYNRFDIDYFNENRLGVTAEASNSGWVTEQNFYGGNWSATKTDSADPYHIYVVDSSPSDPFDQWHFFAPTFEGGAFKIGVKIGADCQNWDFHGARWEYTSQDYAIESAGSNISFYSGLVATSDPDIHIISGAGRHLFIGVGGSGAITDENVPTVAVGAFNDTPYVPTEFAEYNFAPDGSCERLEQPPLVSGNDISLLPAGWIWSYSSFGSGITGSAETSDIKDGAQSLKLVNVDSSNPRVGFLMTGLTSGAVYTIRFYIKCTDAIDVLMRVGSSLSGAEDLDATYTQDGNWMEITRKLTAGATSRYWYLQFSTSSAFTCYIDGLTINRGLGSAYRHTPRPITEDGGVFAIAEDTATNIADVAASINTAGKRKNKLVFDTTNKRILRAAGSLTTSEWAVIDGSAQVTPS